MFIYSDLRRDFASDRARTFDKVYSSLFNFNAVKFFATSLAVGPVELPTWYLVCSFASGASRNREIRIRFVLTLFEAVL